MLHQDYPRRKTSSLLGDPRIAAQLDAHENAGSSMVLSMVSRFLFRKGDTNLGSLRVDDRNFYIGAEMAIRVDTAEVSTGVRPGVYQVGTKTSTTKRVDSYFLYRA